MFHLVCLSLVILVSLIHPGKWENHYHHYHHYHYHRHLNDLVNCEQRSVSVSDSLSIKFLQEAWSLFFWGWWCLRGWRMRSELTEYPDTEEYWSIRGEYYEYWPIRGEYQEYWPIRGQHTWHRRVDTRVGSWHPSSVSLTGLASVIWIINVCCPLQPRSRNAKTSSVEK